MRVEHEALGSAVLAAEARQPGHERQLGSQMPRRPALQEAASLFRRQFGNSPEIHINAGGERCLNFIEGSGEGRDIEINADRLPALSVAIGIAAKRMGHAGPCGLNGSGRMREAVNVAPARVHCQNHVGLPGVEQCRTE